MPRFGFLNQGARLAPYHRDPSLGERGGPPGSVFVVVNKRSATCVSNNPPLSTISPPSPEVMRRWTPRRSPVAALPTRIKSPTPPLPPFPPPAPLRERDSCGTWISPRN
eukprot:496033-Prorocentrum_minimum.AAC.1